MSKTTFLNSAIAVLSLFRAKSVDRRPSIFTMWLDVVLLDLVTMRREIIQITSLRYAVRAMTVHMMTIGTGKTNLKK